MTLAAALLTNGYCDRCKNHKNAIALSHFSIDLATIITTLVVGILGAVSVIGMQPAVAYSLIGVGGGVLLIDTAAIMIRRCLSNKQRPNDQEL